MSSKLRKKTTKNIGFTKNQTKEINKSLAIIKARDNLVIRSYKDFIIIGYECLHWRFGFGLKRIQRTEKLINAYLEKAETDKNMNGKALAHFLSEKHEINVNKISNSLSSNQIIKLYFNNKTPNRIETCEIVRATIFNYMAIILTILKTAFSFSKKNLNEFVNYFTDLFDTLARVEQFDLTIPMIVKSLANETKYVCDYTG